MPELTVKSEEEGKLNFFILANKNNIYAYDPVLESEAFAIVEGLKSIQCMAVDKSRNYLYVADFDQGRSLVIRYSLEKNLTNKS